MSEDRPYTVALSNEEVVALVRWHTIQMRKISNALGKAQLTIQSKSLFPSGRELKKLHDEAKALVEQHSQRARGLLSIVKQ